MTCRWLGAPVAGNVDEEGLVGGNPGDSYPDPVSGRGVADDLGGVATVATGSLNISFGSDDTDDAADGAVQDSPSGLGDRSVTFADGAVAGNNVVNAGGVPLALTSDGVALTYALNADGTVLTATAGARTVFTVALSDDGAGSYTFTLLDNLDHPTADTEDDLVLNFTFTATDSDGDDANSSFQVTVDDDGPVIGAPVASSVDEEGLGGNAGDSYPDPVSGRGVAGDLAGTATIATGVLNIGFGADDTDAAADGATQDTPGGDGNRSVTFTDTTVGNAGNNVVDATGAPLAPDVRRRRADLCAEC